MMCLWTDELKIVCGLLACGFVSKLERWEKNCYQIQQYREQRESGEKAGVESVGSLAVLNQGRQLLIHPGEWRESGNHGTAVCTSS